MYIHIFPMQNFSMRKITIGKPNEQMKAFRGKIDVESDPIRSDRVKHQV